MEVVTRRTNPCNIVLHIYSYVLGHCDNAVLLIVMVTLATCTYVGIQSLLPDLKHYINNIALYLIHRADGWNKVLMRENIDELML